MVYERFYGVDERYSGWRCVLCGEIIDQIILENRRRRGGDKIGLKGERVTPDSQTFFEPLPIMFRIDWRLSIRFLMWIRRYDPINSISEV